MDQAKLSAICFRLEQTYKFEWSWLVLVRSVFGGRHSRRILPVILPLAFILNRDDTAATSLQFSFLPSSQMISPFPQWEVVDEVRLIPFTLNGQSGISPDSSRAKWLTAPWKGIAASRGPIKNGPAWLSTTNSSSQSVSARIVSMKAAGQFPVKRNPSARCRCAPHCAVLFLLPSYCHRYTREWCNYMHSSIWCSYTHIVVRYLWCHK